MSTFEQHPSLEYETTDDAINDCKLGKQTSVKNSAKKCPEITNIKYEPCVEMFQSAEAKLDPSSLNIKVPRDLSKQSKEIIARLISYFECERDYGGSLQPLNAVQRRVADAAGVSISTVRRISAARRAQQPITDPKRKRPHKRKVRDVDDFSKAAIRNVVDKMYAEQQHITHKSILRELRNANIFQGGITTLGKLLKDIGFKLKRDPQKKDSKKDAPKKDSSSAN